jgi:hypothetical protein
MTISNAFHKTFEENVRHLAQQQETALRRWVVEKNKESTSHSFSRMGAMTMLPKDLRESALGPDPEFVGRMVATPYEDPGFSNRIAIPRKVDGGFATEKEDLVKGLKDPNSQVARALSFAAKRAIDDLIIVAADADALDDAGAPHALPEGQIVGDGSAEFSFDMITEVNEKFLTNEIDPGEPKCFVISPTMARLLLHEARATSSDFVGAMQSLVHGGYVRSFLGFDFIVSNRLTSAGEGMKTALAFTRQAIGLLTIEDIYTEIAKDPSISFAWRIYAAMNMGAVRVEDEQIVAVNVLNTATIA